MRAAVDPALLGRDDAARRASSTSSRSTCPPSSPTPTSSTCSTSPASRCTPTERASTDPVVLAGGHCTYNPEPLADFLDACVLGDGEEVVSELHEVIARVARGRARAARPPRAAPRARRRRGRLRPEPLHAALRRRAGSSGYDAADGAPATVEKRTVADLADWPYPRAQLVPLTEVVHDRLNVEVFRGCTRGCRFCQAGMITRPVRERPRDQVLAARPRRDRAHGLRRGRAHVAVDGGLLGHRGRGGRAHRAGQLHPRRRRLAAVAARGRLHRRDGRGDPAGAAHRADLRARGRHLAHAPGHQQAHQRRGPVQRRRRRVLPGLAPDQAVLHHRAPDRARRGRRRHRELAAECVRAGAATTRAPRSPPRWAGSCPRPTRRSSGTRWTRPTSCAARWHCSATMARGTHGLEIRWHDPDATAAEGIVSRGDRRIGAVLERVWRDGGTFQEWSECFDALAAGPTPSSARASTSSAPRCARGATHEMLPWAHLSAGLHPDFLWDDYSSSMRAEGARGLPLDALLRLRRVHDLRDRARRRVGRPARGRLPGHRAGARPLGRGRRRRALDHATVSSRTRCPSDCACATRSSAGSGSPRSATSRASWSARCGAPSCRSRTRRGSRRARS